MCVCVCVFMCVWRQGYMTNNQCYLLICLNFKCDKTGEAVVSCCVDRMDVLHHGFLFMFPAAVKPFGGEKNPTDQSWPSETLLLRYQEAAPALMKQCHSLGLCKQAADNWLPAANVNLLMPQPAGCFHFSRSEMVYRASK